MVNIGSAPGSSNVAKVTVLPDHPKTMVIIGADQGPGTADGPSRKVDVYEDVLVHGNAQVGEVSCVRTRWPQGVDGIIHRVLMTRYLASKRYLVTRSYTSSVVAICLVLSVVLFYMTTQRLCVTLRLEV